MQKAGARSEVVLGEYYMTGVPEFQPLGRGYAQRVLAGERVPTAIFAASDILAAGVLQALYAEVIRVPEHVSVVGFDDTYAARADTFSKHSGCAHGRGWPSRIPVRRRGAPCRRGAARNTPGRAGIYCPPPLGSQAGFEPGRFGSLQPGRLAGAAGGAVGVSIAESGAR